MAFLRDVEASARLGRAVFVDDGTVDSPRNSWVSKSREAEIRQAAQTSAPDVYSAALLWLGRSESTHSAGKVTLKI